MRLLNESCPEKPMKTEKFKHIILTYQPAMQRMAEAILKDGAMAEDAVQEAMIALWNHRDRLEKQPSIEGYCISTVKNHSITLLRKLHPTQEIDEEVLRMYELPSDDLEERYQKAMGMIKQLPELQQKAILLRYEEEKGTEEITKELHISSSNLYTTISRALKTLKEMMEK